MKLVGNFLRVAPILPLDHQLAEHERLILQSLPAAVYTCDLEGRVLLFNQAAAALWGRVPEVSKDLWCGSWRIYYPDGAPMEIDDCPMAVTIRDKKAVRGKEIIVERPDGTRRHILPHPDIIYDDAGIAIGAINMLVDITEHKQSELALIANEEALRESRIALEASLKKATEAEQRAIETNRRKDDFLATMSHDLRTPLNAIIGLGHILARTSPLTDMQKKCIDTLQLSSESLLSLINDLLDISKIQDNNLVLEAIPFDLHQLLQDAVSISSVKANEKKIELVLHDDKAINGNFIGDPHRLKQVVLNLLSNAIKFTHEGGVTLQVKMQGEQLLISVIDTGIGIHPDKLESIFDKFSQADASTTRQFGGSGLGLTISKKLVALMGGEILVESKLGDGSIFTIRLTLPRQ